MYYIFLCVRAQQKSAFNNQCTHMHTHRLVHALYLCIHKIIPCVCVLSIYR